MCGTELSIVEVCVCACVCVYLRTASQPYDFFFFFLQRIIIIIIIKATHNKIKQSFKIKVFKFLLLLRIYDLCKGVCFDRLRMKLGESYETLAECVHINHVFGAHVFKLHPWRITWRNVSKSVDNFTAVKAMSANLGLAVGAARNCILKCYRIRFGRRVILI